MRHLRTTLAAIAFGAVCSIAHAQDAALPSAPPIAAPAPQQQAKPSFALPPETFTPPQGPPPPDPKKEEVCYAPPEGIYTKQNEKVPEELKGQFQSYLTVVYSRIFSDWSHHMSVSERNAWNNHRFVAIRFAIFQDGTYDTPTVTFSSGNPKYDEYALEAITAHGSFPPPPGGMHHPFPVCVKIGHHLRMTRLGTSNWMNQLSTSETDPATPDPPSATPKP